MVEIASGGGKNPTKNWIKSAYPRLQSERNNDEAFDRFEALVAEWNAPTPQAKSAAEYLWQECRLAVAHGSEKSTSDPDTLVELRRLHTVAGIMRWLARKAIREKLGVPGAYWERS